MDFKELVETFAKRHNVTDLVPEDDGISIDIDGIMVSVVTICGEIMIAAEIGEPPVEGKAEFSDAMLAANMESMTVFAKSVQTGKYMLMRRLGLLALDADTFDNAIESLVNEAEVWRKMLEDFRPVAKTAAERSETEVPSFGSTGFMQV